MVQVVAFSAVVSGDNLNHSSAEEARKSRDMEMQTIRHATIHIQATAVRLIEFDSVTSNLDVKVVIQLLNTHNIQGAPG